VENLAGLRRRLRYGQGSALARIFGFINPIRKPEPARSKPDGSGTNATSSVSSIDSQEEALRLQRYRLLSGLRLCVRPKNCSCGQKSSPYWLAILVSRCGRRFFDLKMRQWFHDFLFSKEASFPFSLYLRSYVASLSLTASSYGVPTTSHKQRVTTSAPR
jgi:hypothetical protein